MALRTRGLGMSAAAVVALLAGTAWAEPPAVLDRVPNNAGVVMTLRSLSQAREKLGKLVEKLNLKEMMDEGGEDPLRKADQLLLFPGINKEGSLALVGMPGPDGEMASGEEKGPGLAIVPVSDYKAMVTFLGGNAGDAVASVKIEGKDNFVRDLGGGFAALSDDRAVVEGFGGKGGNAAGHMKMIGAQGAKLADTADLLVFANAAAMRPQMAELGDQIGEQAEMAAMMSGNPDAAENIASMTGVMARAMKRMREEGSAGLMAVTAGEKGVSLNFGAQFKEGTETATLMSNPGASSKLMARLPSQPFYVAGAMDFSQPAIKQAIKDARAAAKKDRDAQAAAAGEKPKDDAAEGAGLMPDLANIDKLDGAAMVWGETPAIMGGLFLNFATYMDSTKPGELMGVMREAITKADGRKEGPVTTKVTYTPGGQSVGGSKVDTWQVRMTADPNDPAGMQAQQMQQMMFGPGGLQGMTAAGEKGVVSVYSANSALMEKALAAASSGKGLGEDAGLRAASAGLPADRNFEVYLGVKPILDSVLGFMMMMGGAPEFEVPASITPIAMSGTMSGGGLNVQVYVPDDAMRVLVDLGKKMREAQNAEGGMDGGDEN